MPAIVYDSERLIRLNSHPSHRQEMSMMRLGPVVENLQPGSGRRIRRRDQKPTLPTLTVIHTDIGSIPSGTHWIVWFQGLTTACAQIVPKSSSSFWI